MYWGRPSQEAWCRLVDGVILLASLRGFCSSSQLPPLNLQTIASPFQFDKLLAGFDSVPYIFEAVMAQADEEDGGAAPAPAALALPARSLSEVLELVGRKVLEILGRQVKMALIFLVCLLLSDVLSMDSTLQVPETQPLMEAGLDSLGAVELRNELSAALGTELPATIIFDHPTSHALATYVMASSAAASRGAHALPAAKRAQLGVAEVADTIAAMVANMLGSEVAHGQPLMEAGLDSLAAVELRNDLSSRFGSELPATAMFDYPTIDALASYIASSSGQAAMPHIDAQLQVASNAAGPRSTHILSSSCRYPSSVRSSDDFWRICSSETDVVQQVPPHLWDLEHFYSPAVADGRMYARFGAFLHGLDEFDRSMFNLSTAEALATDPQQRILLEQTLMALKQSEAAGGPWFGSEMGTHPLGAPLRSWRAWLLMYACMSLQGCMWDACIRSTPICWALRISNSLRPRPLATR